MKYKDLNIGDIVILDPTSPSDIPEQIVEIKVTGDEICIRTDVDIDAGGDSNLAHELLESNILGFRILYKSNLDLGV